MIVISIAMLTAWVTPAAQLSATPAQSQFFANGAVTAQLESKDDGTRRPTVCTEQYGPVCGRIDGVVKTYSNQCFARAAGADVIAQGPCTDSGVPPGPR